MRLTSCALVVIGCLWVGAARAQDYNPAAGASTAPANGSLTAPASPNGVDWLNSMLGLSPSFLSADGKVTATYLTAGAYTLPAATSSSLGGVKVGTGLSVATDGTVTVSSTLLSGYAQLAVQNVFNQEQHFAYASFADPDQDAQRDAKFGDKGIAVGGGTKTDTLTVTGAVWLTSLTGTGNGYACLSSTGAIYRSATACN